MLRVTSKALAATTAAGLIAYGCGSDSGSSTEPLSEENTQQAGTVLAGQIETAVSNFHISGATQIELLSPSDDSVFPWVEPAFESVENQLGTDVRTLAAECHTVDGDPEDDPDGDDIPTDVTVTYNCSETDPDTGATFEVTGSVRVQDTSDEASFDFRIDYNDIRVESEDQDSSFTVTVNGSIVGSEDESTYSVSQNVSLSVDSTADGESHHISQSTNWTVTYTPDGSWTLWNDLVGDLTVDGSWSIRIDNEGASMQVQTTPSVHVDEPGCFDRVDDGSLEAQWTNGGESAELTVSWSGCGSREVNHTVQDTTESSTS